MEAEFVYKISEGRPNVEDRLKNGDIALVINTSDTKSSVDDGKKIRQMYLDLRSLTSQLSAQHSQLLSH